LCWQKVAHAEARPAFLVANGLHPCCFCCLVCIARQVRTMREHIELMRILLSRDVAYQAPIIAAYDR